MFSPVHILRSFLGGCAILGVGGLAASEEISKYTGELILAEASLAGSARVIELAASVPGNGGKGERVYRPLKISRGEQPLVLTLGSAQPDSRPVVRLMTRLEGWEEDWQDNDGTMYLMLRYLDENNRGVGRATFARLGSSPGWNGLPQTSRFSVTTEETVVPERARKIQFLLASGGPTRTTGFWAVRSLRLSVAPNEQGAEFVPLYALGPLQGRDLNSPRGTPAGWVRDGTSVEIPQVLTLDRSEPTLLLDDVDPNNTGGWMAAERRAISVEPGSRVRIESEELYSIGRGLDGVVTFRNLPVGRYVFRARATDELGRPTGSSLRLPVEVLPPFYLSGWFRLLVAGLGLTAVFAVIRYLTWRKMQGELRRLERQRAVDEERTRLARDLHDEMGARLTQISLLATRALPPLPANDPAREPIGQIQGAVRDLATSLDEIVWAANPALDTLEGFGNYLTRYANEILSDAGLRCRLEIPALLPARSFSSGTRHCLMMAVKEALTNVLKHAGASEVRISLKLVGDVLELTIADNGRGFDPAVAARRNGLNNLCQRLAEMGGRCEIESRREAGTCVRLTLPLPHEEESR